MLPFLLVIRCVSDVQTQALMRVHTFGFSGRYAKQSVVEVFHSVNETAMFCIQFARISSSVVVVLVHIP
jgi:hypothetical protein